MFIDILLLIVFSVCINWLVSLNNVLQLEKNTRTRYQMILLSLVIGSVQTRAVRRPCRSASAKPGVPSTVCSSMARGQTRPHGGPSGRFPSCPAPPIETFSNIRDRLIDRVKISLLRITTRFILLCN
jgi:hypothetical protein